MQAAQISLHLRHDRSSPKLPRWPTPSLLRARERRRVAFERIMRRHNRLLFRTARSILKSDAEPRTRCRKLICARGGRSPLFALTRNCRPGWCASSSTRRWAGCAAMRASHSSGSAMESSTGTRRNRWRRRPRRRRPRRMRSTARFIEARIDCFPKRFALCSCCGCGGVERRETLRRFRSLKRPFARASFGPQSAARRFVARRRSRLTTHSHLMARAATASSASSAPPLRSAFLPRGPLFSQGHLLLVMPRVPRRACLALRRLRPPAP